MLIQVAHKRLQPKKNLEIIQCHFDKNPNNFLEWKGIFLSFIESPTITGDVYANLSKTDFFPWVGRNKVIKNEYFMQDGATHDRTEDVFDALQEIYDTCIVELDYPKFANTGMECPLCSPDLNPSVYFFRDILKIDVTQMIHKQWKSWKKLSGMP